ncbi:Tetraspanin family-domain-containing protein [Phlyctochytrium arcticum]|nr:Tetraspanin family-domain-containing protein [Phlyctochytrium arcticum]
MPFLNRLSTFSFNKESFMALSGFMVVKNLLLLINFLSMLAGIILIGGGAYLTSTTGGSNSLLNLGSTVAIAAIIIGIIVTIVSFFGCFGAANEKGMLLKTYFALLIILVVLEISVGIAAYAKRNTVEQALGEAWESAHKNNATMPILQLEITFGCCGFRNVTNYPVPSSPNECATVLQLTEPIGCADAVRDSLQGKFSTIGAAGLVIGVIESVGLVFSAIMFRRIAAREQAAGSLMNEAWRINRNKIQYGYQNYQYV